MGTLILIGAMTFAFTIWPLKKVAEWLGAEKTGYGSVILALVYAFLLAIVAAVLSIPLAFLGTPGYVAIFALFVFVIGKAYSKALETPFWNGVGIAVFSAIFGGVLQVVFSTIFGLGVSVPTDGGRASISSGDLSIAAIEEAAGEVCRCGTNRECLDERMGAFSGYMHAAEGAELSPTDLEALGGAAEQAIGCYNDPKDAVAAAKAPARKRTPPAVESETVKAAPAPAQAAAPPAPAPAPKKVSYGWQTVEVADLPRLRGKELKVVTTEGRDREGRLVDTEGGEIVLEKSRGLSYTIPFDMIGSIEVYDELP